MSMQEAPQGSETPPESQNTGTQETQGQGQESSGYSDFVNGLLKDVPELHRPLLEPYVKQWDQGVNKRFQELHEKYKPYEELGDLESLQQQIAVAQFLDENPQEVAKLLLEDEDIAKALGYTPSTQQQNPTSPLEQSELPPELQQYFQPFQEKQGQLEQIVTNLAEFIIQQQQQSSQSQEDAQLDKMLSEAKQKYGEFEEDYVLTKMLGGMDIDAAVQAYQNLKGGSQPAPHQQVLSGGGGPPSDALNVRKLSSDQVQELVANAIAQANRGG